MSFVQTIAVHLTDPDAAKALMDEWHAAEAGVAPGYMGGRLLADREEPGNYLLVVEFASAEDADRNNERAETQSWAVRFNELVTGEADFGNYDEVWTAG